MKVKVCFLAEPLLSYECVEVTIKILFTVTERYGKHHEVLIKM